MKAITLFQTTDGQKFEDETVAAAHQAGLDNKARIDAFVDKHYPKAAEGAKAGPMRSIAGKVVAQWLADESAKVAA